MATKATAKRKQAAPRSSKTETGISAKTFQATFEAIVKNIKKVIKGKDEIIRRAVVGMVADGHILFDDYPGTGKTMLARAIAQTINSDWSRIQCTPDLLPGDITGSPVLDRKTGDFVFRPGPIFASVFLADEVNRATPKTQSALLEAMQEKNVTVDGVTYALPRPFFVLATQNPIELAGTFPLPEAQLDRFLFKLSLGYAERDAEAEVLRANSKKEAILSLEPVVETEAVIMMTEWASDVTISESITYYIIDLVDATRRDPALQLGASTRASLALMRASRVLAASQGRDDVIPDDVKILAAPVLAHRLILTPDAQLRDETVEMVVERVATRVKVPVGLRRAVEEPETEAVDALERA